MAGPKATVELTAKDSTKAGLSQVEQSIAGFANKASNLLKGAFAAVVGGAIGGFFKAAIAEAAEGQRNLADLSIALRNTGADAATAAPQIDRLVKSLARSTGIDSDEIAASMNRLISMTGNYKTAMQALPTVLDVAKFKHIDLQSAAAAVNKALSGNEGAVKKLGVAIRDGETPFDALRRTMRGIAEAEGQTLDGTLGRLKEGYKAVLEAVGNAIVGNDTFAQGSNFLVEALASVAKWVEANSDNIGYFMGLLKVTAGTVVDVGKTFVDLATNVYQFAASLLGVNQSAGSFKRDIQSIEVVLLQVGSGFKMLGSGIKLMWAEVLETTASFVEGASGVLSKLGIHIGDGMVQGLRQSADAFRTEAEHNIDVIQNELVSKIKGVYAVQPQKPKATTPTAATPAPSMGAQSKEQIKQEDKDFKENVAGLKAQLDIDDLRVNAMEKLRKLSADELASVHNSTLSADERVKHAERLGQVMSVLNADDQSHYTASLEANKALLDFDDQRTGAMERLVALRDQEKAISDDTSRSEQDRLKAQARYKQVQDAILSEEDRAYKQRLTLDQSALKFSDLRAQALQDLRDEMARQLKIAQDTTKSVQERVAAEERLKQIQAITGDQSLSNVAADMQKAADASDSLSDHVTRLQDAWLNSFEAIGQGANVFQTLGKAAKQYIADEAKNRAKKEFAEGIASLATGTWPPNPAALKAAGLHFASAAAFAAIGGAAGGSSGGAGGSGGASRSGLADATKAASESKPDATIIINGGMLDMNDPRQADALANAIGTLSGRRVILTSN